MRRALTALLALAPLLPLGLPAAGRAAPPTKEEDKVLYALGVAMADQLRPFALSEAELGQVAAGMKDAAQAAPAGFDMNTWRPKVMALQKTRASALAEKAKGAGKAFLDKAAAEPGAKKLPSGMVYQAVKEGTGAQPNTSNQVKVHYKGTLINGETFDSSYDRGEPITFPLNGVVKCWQEGVAQMKAGGKARLVCPPELAYGDRGAPPKIGPGSTLNFEVELLEVK